MRYHFLNFEFNSTRLILTRDGEDIAIRHNEAKLLALMLSQPTHVFSKEEILDAIWQDKVVSEQAVFQNISHLRSLFGNEAIKTFSKRGYQWQLKTYSTDYQTNTVPNDSSVSKTLNSTVELNHKHNIPRYIATFACALLVLIGFMQLSTNKIEQNGTLHRIAYIPFSSSIANTQLTLEDTPRLDFTLLNSYNSDDFSTTAEQSYPSIKATHQIILSGQLRAYNNLFFLDFNLKGPFDEWQGQLSGNSLQDVDNKLIAHLQKPFIYSLIEQPQPPEIKQAALTIAHQSDPNDAIILHNLIASYIQLNELDKAMVMTNKLILLGEHNQNPQQLGNAYLKQSEILTQSELSESSEEKLKLALVEFQKIADLKRQSDTLYAYYWLYHLRNDYPAIKQSLLSSANLALQANDKSRELDALTYLSVLASKHQQSEEKYQYLRQAEIKMRQYKLPLYYYAKIPFHYAIFAKSDAEKEPHLKQVLEFAALTPTHWVAQAAREQLLMLYIKRNNLLEAQALVDDIKLDTAENSYLKALLAKAEAKPQQALDYAKRTFEQARLAGKINLSLDASLFLLTQHQNESVDYDFHRLYIKKHAPKYWISRHQATLSDHHIL